MITFGGSFASIASKYGVSSMTVLRWVNEFREECLSDEEVGTQLETVIGTVPTNEMLIWGYLARLGKIPPEDYSTDYLSGHCVIGRRYFKYNVYRYVGLETNTVRIRYYKWLDETLRSNGFEYPLLFVEYNDAGPTLYSDPKEIKFCDHVNYRTTVYWEPIEPYIYRDR